ncbi:MAG: UrcA family protein [Novosphingobium sp.]|nr:UrcA family protein [Novosphingobium sp.]
MNRKVATVGKVFAMALALASGRAVLAQEPESDPAPAVQDQEEAEAETPAQEIVVVAPRPVKDLPKEIENDSNVLISLRMVVLYNDLDLTSKDDQDRLMTRIKSSARDACRYLDRLYPLDPDPECEDRAIRDTRPQVDAAIAAFAPTEPATETDGDIAPEGDESTAAE